MPPKRTATSTKTTKTKTVTKKTVAAPQNVDESDNDGDVDGVEQVNSMPKFDVEEVKKKRTVGKTSTATKTKKQKTETTEKNGTEDTAAEPKNPKPQPTTSGKRGAKGKNKAVQKEDSDEEDMEVDEPKAADLKKPKIADAKASAKRGRMVKQHQADTKANGDVKNETDTKNAAENSEEPQAEIKENAKNGTGGKKVVEKAEKQPKEISKAAAKRGGKAKSAEEVEKVLSDEDVDTEKIEDKDISTKSNGTTDDEFHSDAKTKDGKAWNLKITSWNVAGIRSWANKGGFDYIRKENPDIIILEETKCTDEDMPKEANSMPGYHAYFQHTTNKDVKGKGKGYAGMGMLSKTKPISVKYGMDMPEHDGEGRLITAEFEKFYIIGAYVPNSGRGLPRLEYRQQWNKDFLGYIKALDAKKPVIYCGDLNVAHQEIDLTNPKTNKKTAGFTKEERDDFTELLSNGFVDSFRYLYPTKTNAYTFWSNMNNARAKNIGWRLDYFVVSDRLKDKICDSVMREKVLGSDHCPLTLFLSI